MSRCQGCGAEFPDREGPVHRYMESSPACWAAFGEILAREYSDPAYFLVHRLSVDAYAVQHPGRPSPQSIQSVAVHLIRLCLTVEKALIPERANSAMLAASARGNYQWLTPPANLGEVTVADVHRARHQDEHIGAVQNWAKAAWLAWAAHHDTVRSWLPAKF